MEQSRWYRQVTRYVVPITLVAMATGLLIQAVS